MKSELASSSLPRRSLERGLTLLELLVVVFIIALLAALLLPVIAQTKRRAQQAQCVSHLRQLGVGLQNFTADNHAYPSMVSGTNSDNPGTWLTQLERGGFGRTTLRSNSWAEGVWRCPSARWGASWQRPGMVPTCYGYNGYGVLPIGNRTNALGLLGRFVSASELFAPIGESEVVNPSEMMAIGDSIRGGVLLMRSDSKHLGRARSALRHQGKENVAFCDGHVESPTLESVFEDTSDAALARWNRDHQPHRDKL